MSKRSIVSIAFPLAILLNACGGGIPSPNSLAAAPATSRTAYTLIENGRPVPDTHVFPIHEVTGTGSNGLHPQKRANITYHQGLVTAHPAVGVVYWGFNRDNADPDNEVALIDDFLAHLGGSAPMSIVTQYYQIAGGVKTYIPNSNSMTVAIWHDDATPLPKPHPADADVRQEALRAAAHFNFGIANGDTMIVVAIPHGIPMNYAACAYHGKVHNLSYTNLPYQPDFGRGCGRNSVNRGAAGVLDGVTETVIHEIAESMTDPQFAGWFGPAGYEIGDKCENLAANADFNGVAYAVQPLWDNASNDCRY